MKGSAIDILYMAIFITVVPLTFVIAHYLTIQLATTSLNNDGYIDDSQDALEVYNVLFPFMYFVIGIGAIALASRISANPIFIGFAILVYSLIMVFVAQISNIYQIVEDEGTLATSFTAFSNVGLIHDNIVIISAVFLFLIGIGMYSKGGVRISE